MITRFAPSPTGFMHIGNLRIALINYLFAKKNNGKFYLRIEDTDKERSNKEFENDIINYLQKLKIVPDNINNIIRQSERIEIYQKIADKLIENGLAYKIYYTGDIIRQIRFLVQNRHLILNDIKVQILFKNSDYFKEKYKLNNIFNESDFDAKNKIKNIFDEIKNDFRKNDIVNYDDKTILKHVIKILYTVPKIKFSFIKKHFIENNLNYITSNNIEFSEDELYLIMDELTNKNMYDINNEVRKLLSDKNSPFKKYAVDKPAIVLASYELQEINRHNFYSDLKEFFDKKYAKYEDKNTDNKFQFAPKIKFYDMLWKLKSIDVRYLNDIIIIKSDGFPTYNFACVIDDISMNITHIIRGSDHLTNTFYQELIRYYLHKIDYKKYEIINYLHLPLVLDINGKKISKRKISDLILRNLINKYSEETILKFAYMLSIPNWQDKIEKIKNIDDLIADFDIDNLLKNSPKLDINKLDYIEKITIRKQLLANEIRNKIKERFNIDINENIIKILKSRMKKLSDFVKYSKNLMQINTEFDEESAKFIELIKNELDADKIEKAINILLDYNLKDDNIIEKIKEIDKKLDLNNKLPHLIRIAIYGYKSGPELNTFFENLDGKFIKQKLKNFVLELKNKND